MRKPFKVVVTDFITEPLDIEREILGEVAEVVALGANTEADFKNSLRQADAIMVYHFVSIGRATIEQLDRCKLIVRCGAGFDNVDYAFARERGIPVANVPDYGTEDVADTALGLVLSLARGTHLYNQLCQRGTDSWTYTLAAPLRRIRGRVFGVIGVGRIGTATALRAKAFSGPGRVLGGEGAVGLLGDTVDGVPQGCKARRCVHQTFVAHEEKEQRPSTQPVAGS